ncbi:PadR family transcriptional regulator [Clostridium fermenticellae]|uniref:PadR family transcriptional regulator n=1 Tax=Clostridium fermenticellae TaxID=2068654 RepID=A0A386H1I5_9CLOT|nr:PadR family transcriptional regulator [Clostridium fermenticellae]AYD39524.1 PadR family transcriptional regulator [Clostridium fermenticellae]
MEFEKELLKGYIDIIVLSVLKHKDMYGYEIGKEIKQSSKNFEMKEATLYVSLKRLEKRNYLEGYWNDDENTGGGRRRYYKITQKGLDFFKEKVKEWLALKDLLDYFLEVNTDE